MDREDVISLNLLSLNCWLEYLGLIFFVSLPNDVGCQSAVGFLCYIPVQTSHSINKSYIYMHWRSKRIDHTEAKGGDAINIVTNLIMTSNYTKNKQKTNLNI